jgi:PelA/Pel-15E family pectate lyase
MLSTFQRNLLLVIFAFSISITHTEAQRTNKGLSWRDITRNQQPAEWYGSEEAIRITDNVLLYQHTNGGWGKNVDRATVLNDEEKAKVVEKTKTVQTTIDNGATVTEIRFLALVYTKTKMSRFQKSIERGVRYLLEAQYDSGGWPQFYPIRDGYYKHITYNDDAMIGTMRLLRDVAEGDPLYAFIDQGDHGRARTAIERGLEIILKTQIEVDGKLTAWCAQHDRETFAPAKARSYELPSISGGESAGIVRYLMSIGNPDDRIIKAVESAIAWYERSKITGLAVVRKEDASLRRGYDRVVIEDPDASPLWARFYKIETNRPMFVGRDGVIKDSLAEIEHERRIGYSYIRDYGSKLLASYPAWKAKWNHE